MNLLQAFLIIVLIVAIIISILMYIYIVKLEAKCVGILHLNKDVNGFYLAELEFDDEVSTFITNDYITLRIDRKKDLYD